MFRCRGEEEESVTADIIQGIRFTPDTDSGLDLAGSAMAFTGRAIPSGVAMVTDLDFTAAERATDFMEEVFPDIPARI